MLTIAVVYVDDVLFRGSNPKLIKKEKGKFMKIWESRDLGEAKEYLGNLIKATSDLYSQYQSVIGSLLYIMLGT